MKQFSDSAGRSWTISLTISVAKRIRDSLGANLLDLGAGDPPLFTRLNDIIFLIDVIFVAIKPQADALGVTDQQFGASLGGECAKAAQEAFYGELVDFFQKLGRQDLAKALGIQRKMIDEGVRQITTRVENLDIKTEVGKILTEVGKTLGPPSTPLPASPA